MPTQPRTRVLLFTDTLGDVNGVSRFIRNIADLALESGRDLRVVTSTKFAVPDQANILNFAPIFAAKMPRYENLEFAIPPLFKVLDYTRRVGATAIHISTPGPVGLVGRIAARRLGVPVLGVYHTDFPAYIERLFDDAAFTYLTRMHMRRFYSRFAAVFTRSNDYASSLVNLGIAPDRIHRLLPGIDTAAFQPRFRDASVWQRLGVPAEGAKVLYCGRVSVEKNLPFLAQVWKQVQRRSNGRDPGSAQLVVVGDGPYRERMQQELEGERAYFAGFRHGTELSTIYASSDLFAFPSTTDTLGQVVMEAQSSGLPVLVTDQGGPKEVVGHERTGFVLPAADPKAWADAICLLISDKQIRNNLAAAAHTSMQPQSIQASFDHFWAIHEAVANGAGLAELVTK